MVDLTNPETTYDLGDVTVKLNDLYPDFEVKDGQPNVKNYDEHANGWDDLISDLRKLKGDEG